MTNAEKFVEVFGTDLKRQYATKSWWEQEFVPASTGHWIGIDQEPHEDWECDRCGHIEYANEDVPDKYHFCPNCGAKMEKQA